LSLSFGSGFNNLKIKSFASGDIVIGSSLSSGSGHNIPKLLELKFFFKES